MSPPFATAATSTIGSAVDAIATQNDHAPIKRPERLRKRRRSERKIVYHTKHDRGKSVSVITTLCVVCTLSFVLTLLGMSVSPDGHQRPPHEL